MKSPQVKTLSRFFCSKCGKLGRHSSICVFEEKYKYRMECTEDRCAHKVYLCPNCFQDELLILKIKGDEALKECPYLWANRFREKVWEALNTKTEYFNIIKMVKWTPAVGWKNRGQKL